MKARIILTRTSAILFLLLFLYKSGGSLFVHNIYHEVPSSKEAKLPGGNNTTNSACTCIDDFLVPQIGADPVDLTYVPSPVTSPTSVFHSSIPVSTSSLTFLRGPP